MLGVVYGGEVHDSPQWYIGPHTLYASALKIYSLLLVMSANTCNSYNKMTEQDDRFCREETWCVNAIENKWEWIG